MGHKCVGVAMAQTVFLFEPIHDFHVLTVGPGRDQILPVRNGFTVFRLDRWKVRCGTFDLFGHDKPNVKGEDDWTSQSDHRIFHNQKIPFIYFGVEDHEDYHQPSDTYETINQDFYVKAVTLIIEVIENFDNF